MRAIKARISFSCILIFIFYSCSSQLSEEDRLLSEMIIGKWTAKNFETIVLNNDNTFLDTIWSEVPYSSSINFVPLMVAEGRYNVKNGMIYFSDVRLTYLRAAADTSVKSFIHIYYPRAVRPSDNDMFIQVLPTFDDVSNSQSLTGKYLMTNPGVIYNNSSRERFFSSRIHEMYEFYPETGSCIYTRKYSIDREQNEITVHSDYSYIHPRLGFSDYDVGFNSFYDVLVMFAGNRMQWVVSDNVLFIKDN